MLTLSQATLETKKILKFAGIFLGGLIGILLIYNIYKTLNPAPPPPPQVSFGKIENLNFPKEEENKKINYSLNTISGTLPNFPTQLKVYRIQKNKANLLALTQVKEKVRNIGFSENPTKLSPGIYQWTDKSFSRRILFNIVSFNFNLSSFYLFDTKLSSPSNILSINDAINSVNSFLAKLELAPNDIDSLKTKTTLFSIKNNSLSPATSLSKTQVIRVDLFQKDIDNLPIVYPGPNSSTINFMVAGEKLNPEIVEANFFNQPISSKSATYPIKTAKTAFEDLKKGKTYIASSIEKNNVLIKNIFLAYFLGDNEQNYLSPVVVFEGDNNFTAYVPAVTDEWVNK